MVSNPLAYLLNPITVPAYQGNWIIIPKISFIWFGVETETVPAYVLLLNWVTEEFQKVAICSSATKCKWELLIKSEYNPFNHSGETPHRLNVLDWKHVCTEKKEMRSVILDIKNIHFYKILLFTYSPLYWKLIGLLTCFVQTLRLFILARINSK